MNNSTLEFANRLKFLREERNLSLSQLAEAANCTKSALSRYENGKVEPSLVVLRRLATYFGVTLDWMCGEGDINSRKYSQKYDYTVVINNLINKNIPVEKLELLVELLENTSK